MATRKTIKPKRCLKFEGYIFMPDETSDWNDLRYLASRTPGRIKCFDEHGNKIGSRDHAFDNLADAINYVEHIRSKLVYKRVKRK